jgi:alpha-mannosidase
VRCLPDGADTMLRSLKSPFILKGARNVFLETVKRGDDDFGGKSKATTIILRLYEAFGGHARAQLWVSSHLPISKAYITNLLEDEDTDDELNVICANDPQTMAAMLKLDFRAFEVKTVKLVLKEHAGAPLSHRESVSPQPSRAK